MRARPVFVSAVTSVATIGLALLVPGDAKADMYSDVANVIEKLIEDNLAKEVIPNAAMKVDAICDYFPSSLATLQRLRFSALTTTVRREVADAIGNAAECALLDASKATLPMKFVDCETLGLKATAGTAPTLLRSQAPDGTAPTTVIERLTATTAPTVNSASSPPPSTGGASGNTCEQAMAKDPSAGLTSLTSKGTTAMANCLASQETAGLETACAVGRLVRDAVDGDKGSLEGDAKRLIVDLIREAIAQPPLNIAITDVKKLATFEHLVEDALLGRAIGDKAIAATVAATFPDGTPQATLDLVTEAVEVVARKQFTSGSLDVILGDLATVVAKLNITPPATTKPTMFNEVKQLLAVAGTTNLSTILQRVRTKDYGGAASALYTTLLNVYCKDTTAPGCDTKYTAARTFMGSLVEYVVDASTSSSNTATAEGALEQAAVDFLEATGGSGLHRNLLSPGFAMFVPQPAYRYAWTPGRAPEARLGAYASVDALTLARRHFIYTSWMYLDLRFSLLDLLGPVREASFAPAEVTGNKWNAYWLSFVVPRLELDAGVPSLSEHLVVGIGGALRLYRAGSDATTGQLNYCFLMDDLRSKSNCSNSPEGYLEASVFAKYLF